jgi:hypothetical protein
VNKADKICEKADLIREHLGSLAQYAVNGRADLAANHFDEIMKLTSDIKSVAHNEED